jgi:hypothetical protein
MPFPHMGCGFNLPRSAEQLVAPNPGGMPRASMRRRSACADGLWSKRIYLIGGIFLHGVLQAKAAARAYPRYPRAER